MRAITLASTSATRMTLLRSAGLEVSAVSPDVDEFVLKAAMRRQGDDAGEMAAALADAKALAVSKLMPGLVVGADQTLDLGGEVMDKPASRTEARDQLLALRGRPHRLYAAATVVEDGTVLRRVSDFATLFVREFSDSFLETYLAHEGEALLGCVGGYRLEGRGVQLFDRIDGDYFTVLGLPLLGLLGALRAHGCLDA